MSYRHATGVRPEYLDRGGASGSRRRPGSITPRAWSLSGLNNRDLVLWSPTAPTDELCAEVEALGTVRYLVPPNALHHTFLGDWQRAYPGATVLCSARSAG